MKDFITLSQGSGGKEMNELIKSLNIRNRGNWNNCDNDAATLDLDASKENRKLVFTTDSFVVTPIFFPGGDIGHLAFSGTMNDLLVMGAKPLGLSLSLIIEEGLPQEDLTKILGSINRLSEKTNVPIVTGDTKVMEKGKIDKIVINTSGIGIIEHPEDELTKPLEPEDEIIISGGLGEHAVALLSKRFDYTTSIITDSKPLLEELNGVRSIIKQAKDPTRGGIAAVLNELCEKNKVSMLLDEEKIPAREEVRKVTEMLGINLYELACEGRFICIAKKENAKEVEQKLKQFNKDASIIGRVIATETSSRESKEDNPSVKHKVIIQTILGKHILPTPTGRIVPRIC